MSIVVQDNGLGIPAEERAKVITRFYRLDRSRSLPGNGLGLPIVAAIRRKLMRFVRQILVNALRA